MSSLNNISKYSMFCDDLGNIWTKTNDFIYKFGKKENFALVDSIAFKNAQYILNLKTFFATASIKENGSGVLQLYPKNDFKQVIKTFHFQQNVTTVLQITNDSLLIGTRLGIYKTSIKNSTIEKLNIDRNLNVRNIIKTSSGNLWVTTSSNGFYLLKGKKLIKMPLDEKKDLEIVHNILEKKQGVFWISTNDGLFKISESELLQYASRKKNSLYYYKFTKENGFNTNEFNGGASPCGAVLNNGELVFPSLDGFVFFDPNEIKSYYPQNNLYVDKVIIDGKENEILNNEINLENNFYRADIYLDVPYYAQAINLHKEVFLVGVSKKWERVGEKGIYSLTNLQHGTYTLKIRVLADENEKYIYKTITIKVASLFYQTWAFKIVSILIGLLLLIFIYNLRTHYITQKNLELELIVNTRTQELKTTVFRLEFLKVLLKKETEQQKKLIGSITHDITTPIKYLALTAEKLYKSDNENDNSQKKYLESIYKSSLKLYNFCKALKDYAVLYSNESIPSNITYHVNDLVEEKIELFSEIAKDKQIVFENAVDKKIVTTISKNIVAVVIHNLIDNAVKYTNQGKIHITATENEEEISLTINDTGIGISDKKLEYYNNMQFHEDKEKFILNEDALGLNLVIQLLLIIQSRIYLKRNPQGGTAVTLLLKKTNHEK